MEKQFYNLSDFSQFCKKNTKKIKGEECYKIKVHDFSMRDTFDSDGNYTGEVVEIRYTEIENGMVDKQSF